MYDFLYEGNKLGYFEFNGYLIFVDADDHMIKFFKKTKSKKEFTFIKYSSIDDRSAFIFYEKGEFNYGDH